MRVFSEKIFEYARRFRIEADHRLVDHDHFRAMHKRARDDQLLAHAMAVALHELVRPLLEVEQREQLSRSVLDLRSVLVVESRDELEELRARQLFVDERAVGNEPELALRGDRIVDDIDAADVDGAARRPSNSGDHPQRRRLAGAIGTEEAEQLALRHFQVDAVDGGEFPVPFRQVRELDHFRAEGRGAPLIDSTSILRFPMRRSSSV